jgi:hypothetical protein
MIEPLEPRIAPATLLPGAFRLSAGEEPAGSISPSVVAVDSVGNTIVAGLFHGQFEIGGLGNSPVADAAGDLYLAKFKPDGSLIWAQKYGGNGATEAVKAIAIDASDNIFVTGEFSSTSFNLNGPGGGITAVGQDVFLFKALGASGTPDINFGTSGLIKWGGADGGLSGGESPSAIAIDSAGRVVVAGHFVSQNAGFGINPATTVAAVGAADGFVFRVNGTTGAPDATFGTGGMIGTALAGYDAFFSLSIDSKNDLFLSALAPGAGGQIEQAVKLSGVNGQPDATFGGGGANGRVQISPPGPDTTAPLFDLTLDHSDRLVGAAINGATVFVFRFNSTTGFVDPSFNGGVSAALDSAHTDVQVHVDLHDQIYVTGNSPTGTATVDRVSSVGTPEAKIFSTATRLLDATISPQGNLVLRGTHTGSPDLDPTAGVLKLPARKNLPAQMADGYVTRIDLYGIDAVNPLTFKDADGDPVTVAITGPGVGHYVLQGNVAINADLASLDLNGTNLQTKVTINLAKGPGAGRTTIGQITVPPVGALNTPQDLGSLKLGPNIVLGDGSANAVAELLVSGRMSELALDDLAANALIRLGTNLPYNDPNPAISDTYNNRPTLTIGDVLGTGVQINMLNTSVPPAPGQPAPTGGGGFGNITIHSWGFTGFLRTTQSIGNFTVLNPNSDVFKGVLEIDKDHVGAMTTANCGSMTIQNGAWGSSGSEIEGDIASFSAEDFLAGATLTAGNIGKVIVGGDFDGTVTLTDPDTLPTFNVNTDFTGTVISAGHLKRLNIRGDFTGSLQALSIGSITAYAFLGTEDLGGEPTTFIHTTTGPLGTITATAGPISNFSIDTALAFKGLKVNVAGLTADTIGIDNVHITAKSIGTISVTLKAATGSSGVGLVGIRDSDFVATATGATKATAGSIGAVSVTLTGTAGGTLATGIINSTFDALVGNPFAPTSTVNTLGNINVKISGQNGANLGLNNVAFSANTVGTVTVNVSRGPGMSSTASAIDGVDFTAGANIGAINISGDATTAQVSDLQVWAGRNVGAVTVKSKDLVNGSLVDSAVLAGQTLALNGSTAAAQNAKLALARLGAVNVSGSITNTDLVAGSAIGAITVGKNVSDSLFLAGATLGSDFAIGSSDDTFQRAASIAALTVKGTFSKTSVVAGVDPGDGVFGNGDDHVALPVALLPGPTSRIGAIAITLGSLGVASGTNSHQYAIEAADITALKVGGVGNVAFPLFLDQGTMGEDATDVLVSLLG